MFECRLQGVDKEEEAALEPFNLKKEREEGFFDAEGNYVEYRLENEITVWNCLFVCRSLF